MRIDHDFELKIAISKLLPQSEMLLNCNISHFQNLTVQMQYPHSKLIEGSKILSGKLPHSEI